MKFLFTYNWMIREEWFSTLKNVPHNELTKERVGGMQSILRTLFHIVQVEHNWICDLKGIPISNLDYESYSEHLNQIVRLSHELHKDVQHYVEKWDGSLEYKELKLIEPWGTIHCTYGEAMRHVIAHEIHHIGQLSIWAREMGIQPVSANLIHKGIMLKSNKTP